ncbi:MAG: BACON domain-containing protein [Odoribacter sp.]
MKKKCRLLTMLMLVGLFSIGLFAVSCSDDETVTVVEKVTLPNLGITQFGLAATGGVSEMLIEPTGDWTITPDAKAPWLTVSPTSGKMTDKKIILTVEANADFVARTAVLQLTVDTVKLPLTISQKENVRMIRVYNNKIVFNNDSTKAQVDNIIANVEIEAVEFPAWIETVVIQKTAEENNYSALITMKSNNFDTDYRKDNITFKDKNSDFKVTFPVECLNFDKDHIITFPRKFNEMFDGKYTDDVAGEFSIYATPDYKDTTIFFAATIYPDQSLQIDFRAPKPTWIKVKEAPAGYSLLVEKRYQLLLEANDKPAFPGPGAKPAVRGAFMYVMTTAEAKALLPGMSMDKYAGQAIRQDAYVDLKMPSGMFSISKKTGFFTMPEIVAACKIKVFLVDLSADPNKTPEEQKCKWATLTEESKVVNGMTTKYVYKITITDADAATAARSTRLTAFYLDEKGEYIKEKGGFPPMMNYKTKMTQIRVVD